MANIRKRFKGTNGFPLSSSGIHFRQMGTWTGIRRRSKLVYIFWRRPVRVYSFVYRYVAKVIFTYILGYKVDVGHMEAVNLISSHKYSEKQIVRRRSPCYPTVLITSLIGIPCCYIAYARELRLFASGRQLHPQGLG